MSTKHSVKYLHINTLYQCPIKVSPAVHGQDLNEQSVDHKSDAITTSTTIPPDFYNA